MRIDWYKTEPLDGLMPSDKKKYELTLYGQHFYVTTDDGEEHVREVADLVTLHIETALMGHEQMLPLRAALKAALSVADELVDLRRKQS